ncbi:MAG: NAD+ synthase, partial [Gammaproteobacteria bacterium]|nr:NAD+ synthase [Gammaproteobacteria bacterium]
MSQTTLRIALAQLDFMVGDLEGNADKIIRASIKARDELSADLILFPELTLTGYPPEDLLLRPSFIAHTEKAYQRILKEATGIHLVFGLPWQEQNKIYNAASVVFNGQELAVAHKQVLPNYSVFDEQRYFHAGPDATVVEVKGVKLGITICEDIWVPTPARQCADKGAQVILNLNASPFHLGKIESRENTVRKRVQETGLPVVYVNLVGGQDELVFDGASFVMDAQGDVIHRADFCVEGVSVVEVDVGSESTRFSKSEI